MWPRLTSRIAGRSMTTACPPWLHSVLACRNIPPTAASSWVTFLCVLWLHTALFWWRCMWATRTNWQMQHWKRCGFRTGVDTQWASFTYVHIHVLVLIGTNAKLRSYLWYVGTSQLCSYHRVYVSAYCRVPVLNLTHLLKKRKKERC